MKHTIWSKVKGFEYLISISGDLIRLKRKTLQFHKLSNKMIVYNYPTRRLKVCMQRSGYVRYSLGKNGEVVRIFAHRLVLSHFCTNPENKPHVNHKDGNTSNNNYENLEWVTPKENEQHSYSVLKKNPIGRKLTQKQADRIKVSTKTVRSLSEEFNVSTGTIKNIRKGKFYATTTTSKKSLS